MEYVSMGQRRNYREVRKYILLNDNKIQHIKINKMQQKQCLWGKL